MIRALVCAASLVLFSFSAPARNAPSQDPLLDRFVGEWVLRGTIAGIETTHDIVAEWVLGHEYVRFRELSREKDAQGRPAYEAIVFIGWDQGIGSIRLPFARVRLTRKRLSFRPNP